MKRIFLLAALIALSFAGFSQTNAVDTALTVTVSNQSVMDINIASFNTARHITIHLNNIVPASNSASLDLRVSQDGTTFLTAASSYAWFWSNKAGFSQNSAGDTKVELSGGGGLQNGTGLCTNGSIEIYNPGNASFQQANTADFGVPGSSGTAIAGVGGAWQVLTAGGIKVVRIYFSTGNISGQALVEIVK